MSIENNKSLREKSRKIHSALDVWELFVIPGVLTDIIYVIGIDSVYLENFRTLEDLKYLNENNYICIAQQKI